MFAPRSIAAGYTQEICIECKTSHLTKTMTYTVTQLADCSSAITNNAVTSTYTFNYAASGTQSYPIPTFFTNQYESDCGAISSCSLMQASCLAALSSPYASIDTAGPISVVFQTGVSAGYSVTFCL